MEYGFTTAAYVVAAVLFILSLGGLSGQESAKRAVWYGIVGMALAVAATLIGPGAGFWLLSLILIAGLQIRCCRRFHPRHGMRLRPRRSRRRPRTIAS